MKALKKFGLIGLMFIVLTSNMLTGVLAPLPSASAAITNTDLSVSISHAASGISGSTKRVSVTMKNLDSTDWIYNVSLILKLDNGLDLASTGYTSTDFADESGVHTQTVRWYDIRDLAPGETYAFSFDVKLRKNIRDLQGKDGALIDFGNDLKGSMEVFGSDDAQTFDKTATATKAFQIKTSPFEVNLHGGGELLKGAGTTSATGDDQYARTMTVEVINNPTYPLTLDIDQTVASGVQVANISDSQANKQLYGASDGKSSWKWDDQLIAPGATKNFTFNAAIFDKLTAGGVINSGAIINDGTALPIGLTYRGTINYGDPADPRNADVYSDTISSSLIAKDIIIGKQIGFAHNNPIGYGDIFTYTLTTQINQYHDMQNVVITDDIGDGQDFLNTAYAGAPYSVTAGSLTSGDLDFATSSIPPETRLTWTAKAGIEYAKGSTSKLEYKVQVRDNWSNGDPIVAGDRLNNTVSVTGVNETTLLSASDSSSAGATINDPTITKEVLNVNGAAPTLENGNVVASIGDTVRFKVTYDASAIKTKQKNVEIVDIFPQGTTVQLGTIQYTEGASIWKPSGASIYKYTAGDPNMLSWTFAEVPKETKLSVEYEIQIENVPGNTNGKQTFNLAKASLQDTSGNVLSIRDEVSLIYAEPVLELTKTANKSTDLAGGDVVTFTLSVKNTGLGAAYEAVVKDKLSAELTNPQIISPAGMALSQAGDTLTFSNLASIAVGGQQDITYTATVDNAVGNARVFKNEAYIHQFVDKPSGQSPIRTYSGGGKTSSVELTAKSPTLTKSIVSPADPSNVRVGDNVVYLVTVNVPAGTKAYNGYIEEQIPDNQTLVDIYTNPADIAGTRIIPSALTGNDKKFSTAAVLNSGANSFYVETKVDRTSSGSTETQTNSATFFWEDAASGGLSHSIDPAQTSATVKLPLLKATLTSPASSMVQGDTAAFTFKIQNDGGNTAYKFTPTVTIPTGFAITDLPDTASVAGNTITFAEEASLLAGASKTYTFTATLTDLLAAGTQLPFTGYSGDYYSTESMVYKLTQVSSTKTLSIKNVVVSQKILTHTNGANSYLRPGDDIEYEITATVLKGTLGYDLAVTDTLPTKFSFISGPTTYSFGDISAAGADEVRTHTVKASVKTSAGVTFAPATKEWNKANATWNTTDNNAATKVTVNAADVGINVYEPSLTIGTIARSATQFNNATSQITLTIPVTNGGNSTAYDTDLSIPLPAEFDFVSVNQGGVYNSGTRTVVWNAGNNNTLDIAKGTISITLVLKLPADKSAGAGKTGISVGTKVNAYYSRDAAESGSGSRTYAAVGPVTTTLNIAPVGVTKTITSTTSISGSYVRPGDTITYQIDITVPNDTTAYGVTLKEILGAEQLLQDIKKDNVSVIADLSNGVLSIGDLQGGTYAYVVTAQVKVDQEFNQSTYTYSNQAEVRWKDGASGSAKGPVSSQVTGTVNQPGITLDAYAVPTTLTSGNATSVVHVEVENAGTVKAYDLSIEVPIPADVTVSTISNGGTFAGGKVTWLLDELAGPSTADLTFIAEQNVTTLANSSTNMTAKLNSYSNTEDGSLKVYDSVAKLVTVTFTGQHTLSGATPAGLSRKAGETAVFSHVLSNTGAGKDTYVITGNAGYPSVLRDVDGNMLAKDADGNGVWDGGAMEIPLPRNASITLKLELTVPMTSPKDEVKAKSLTSTSKSAPAQTHTVTDTITVVGESYNGVEFDGITAPKDADNWQDNWSISTVGEGAVLRLTALTSHDITSVTAQVKRVGAGYIGGTDVTPIQLTKLENGKWSANYTLPNDLTNGSYIVEYRSYNSQAATQLQDIDTESQQVNGNNGFIIAEPSLSIALDPGTTVVEAVYSVPYTITIDNLGGGLDAYQFVPYVIVPEGTQYSVTESVYTQYDAGTRKLSFYSDETFTPFDLAMGGTMQLNFTLITNADVSADEILTVTAGTGTYYTAKSPLGDSRADKTATASLTTGTVTLSKTVFSTTNPGEAFIRPGDQIVYRIFIDVPDGISVVSQVYLGEQLSDNLYIEKIVIEGGDTMEGNGVSSWSRTFPVINGDQTVYVFAVAKTDIAANTFVTQADTQLTWESNYRKVGPDPYEGQATASIATPGKRPLLLSSDAIFTGDKTELTSPTDVITFTGTVMNSGDSTAHKTSVVASFPGGLEPVAGTYGSGQYDKAASTITWTSDVAAGAGHAATYTFGLKAKADTALSAAGNITFNVGGYDSTSNPVYTAHYAGFMKQVAFGLTGGHEVTGHADKSVKAGEKITFTHVLKNLGAGKDCYTISITSPFGYVLKAGDTVVTGKICLNAGEQRELTIEVTVPVTTPKNATGTSHPIEIAATGEISGNTERAQNTLTVVGEQMDGWVGNQLWAQWNKNTYRTLWTEQTFYPLSAMKLSALTSSDVAKVKAFIRKLDGGVPGDIVDEVELTVRNPKTFLADGHKLWENVEYTLDENIGVGRYFIEYKASNAADMELESDNTPTADQAEYGFNNYFSVRTQINLVGTISEMRNPSHLIEGATVRLLDMNGREIGSMTTDATGNYRFDNISIKNYVIEVEHRLYSQYSRRIQVIPSNPTDTEVRRDVKLVHFKITLEANPSTIVGDGVDTTVLTITVADADGVPLGGVAVRTAAAVGTFMGDPKAPAEGVNTAITDSKGRAYILYRSEKIDGLVSQEIPVTVTVEDPVRDLYAEDIIYVIFAPGAIRGTVLDDSADNPVPVNGAKVFVYSDFDRDGIIDFSATQTTGADGKYKIAIPRGEVPYMVEITKPVLVNNKLVDMTFKQRALPDVVNHVEYVEYPSVNTATGVILQKNSDDTESFFQPGAYSEMKINQVRKTVGDQMEFVPSGLTGAIDPATGIFTIENLPANAVPGTKLSFGITRAVPISTGSPITRDLIVGTIEVQIDNNGDVVISESLIDPYGTITDAVTNAVIKDANVKLYYADTARNRTKGNTPNTLVPLPLLEAPPFPPANNANPQFSDAFGNYAWMVFPESDYYIVADKPGYYTYTSPTISVEWAIVRHDFKMSPVVFGGGGFIIPPIKEPVKPTGEKRDLAISISADSRSYMEGSNIGLAIDYINRTGATASGVVITLDLPDHTVPVDLGGGMLSESGKQVTWELGYLDGGQTGTINVVLKAEKIEAKEQELYVFTEINSADTLINLNDDQSGLKLMLFSNRFGTFEHYRYIVGYPDGEFKLDRKITRAEIANIFARILNLRGFVQGEQIYSDVPAGKWHTDGVEAVTRRGLFKGYSDGTFKPDQPITRAELTTVIFNYLELTERAPVKAKFKDLASHWAANIIEDVSRNRIAEGYLDGTFRPNNHLVRSEAVTMINRLLYRGPLFGTDQSFPDVPKDHWAFGDVEESTRSHEATRNPDSSEQYIRDIETPLGF